MEIVNKYIHIYECDRCGSHCVGYRDISDVGKVVEEYYKCDMCERVYSTAYGMLTPDDTYYETDANIEDFTEEQIIGIIGGV